MKGKTIRVMQITAEYDEIYLFLNTKKPYWKRKPFAYIGPHQTMTWDFLNETIDCEKIYFKEGPKGKLFPLEKYEHWFGL